MSPRDWSLSIVADVARAHLSAEDNSGAIYYALKALNLDPNCTEAICIQGEVLLRENRKTDALMRFREALRLDPECAWAKRQIEQLQPSSHQADEIVVA